MRFSALRGATGRPEVQVTFWMGTLAITSSGFALLSARWLGASDRGVVVILLTTSSFLMLIGSLGLGTGGRVLLHHEQPLSLSTYMAFARILSVSHLITTATAGLAVLWVSNGLPTPVAGICFVLYAVGLLYGYFGREGLHGIGRHVAAMLCDVVPAFFQLSGIVLLNVFEGVTLNRVLLVLVVSAVAQAVLVSWLLRGFTSELSSHWGLRRAVAFSLPALVTALGQAFVIRGDRLILGTLGTTSAVGVYGVAATFTELLWLAPGAIAQVVFRATSTSRDPGAGSRVRKITLGLTIIGGIIIAFSAEWTIESFLGSGYADAVDLVYILLVAAIPFASYHLDISVINGLGQLRTAGAVTITGSAVLAVGCFALVPSHGAEGAAWASLIAYTTMAIFARRKLSRFSTIAVATARG